MGTLKAEGVYPGQILICTENGLEIEVIRTNGDWIEATNPYAKYHTRKAQKRIAKMRKNSEKYLTNLIDFRHRMLHIDQVGYFTAM